MSIVVESTVDPAIADSSTYRTFLSIDEGPEVIDRIAEQFSSWLREKGWDLQLSVSGFYEEKDRDLLVLHHRSADGVAFRGRLIERTTIGTWRTQLTAFAPRKGSPWVSLEVTNSEGRFVSVPRVAAYLMDTLPTRDGESLLSSAARIVGSNGVDSVLASIRDPTRQGLYLVAGTSHVDIDLEVFRRQVDRWTRQVRGLAQVVVLNADATKDLAAAFGGSHAVRPWTLRTFKPDADPSNVEDGLRHKFLSTQRLATEKEQIIVKLLGRVARRHSSRRNPPDGFTRVDRALARLEDSLLFDALASASATLVTSVPPIQDVPAETPELPPVATDPPNVDVELAPIATEHPKLDIEPASRPSVDSDAARALDLVKIIFGIDEVTEERLRVLADEAERGRRSEASLDRIRDKLERDAQEIAHLQDRLALTNDDFETALLDAAIAEGDATAYADEVRWLRGRLAVLKDFESAYNPPPDDSRTRYPNDFDELVSKLDDLESRGVIFTGNKKGIPELDEFDTLNRAVKLAWDALLSLTDYVQARGEGKCELGLKQYLENTPQGFRAVAPKKFAEGESAATMSAYGTSRVFPVPASVNRSGRTSMEAHFKLGKLGRISPRMHFVDCWPIDGRVYVGYIGRHLPIVGG